MKSALAKHPDSTIRLVISEPENNLDACKSVLLIDRHLDEFLRNIYIYIYSYTSNAVDLNRLNVERFKVQRYP